MFSADQDGCARYRTLLDHQAISPDLFIMHAVFINRYFYPDQSATSQMLTELAEDLCHCGETVTVITGRAAYLGGQAGLPFQETYRSIEIRRVWSSNFGRLRPLGRLADYVTFYGAALWASLRLKRSDCLVVLSDPPLLSVLAVWIQAVKGCKSVCWLQDVFPEIAVRAGLLREGLLVNLLRRLARWSLHRLDRTIVLGRCMEQHLRSCGLPAHKMVTIPNWSDGKLLHPVDRQVNGFRKENGLLGHFIVMYSGNLGIVHEFETIQEMIREASSVDQICFCFLGDGYQKGRLAETAEREGWKNVLFLPYQAKEKLKYSLAAADVHLISLRQDMEGLSVPSKIYGIMAAGKPAIFIGPEESEAALIVRESGAGYVIRPGDSPGAIATLLTCYQDRAKLEKQGQAAREYFERHCDRSIGTAKFRQVLSNLAPLTSGGRHIGNG